METQARIYVAGHRGLVGSAIIRRLKRGGYENLLTASSSELDLRRQAEVEAFFERERPDYVFLAAAKVGGIHANNTYRAEFIYDNLTIASNIIHSAYRFGAKKLLNLGSSCIYPKLAPQPMREEYLLTGSLETTNEPYAVAKIAAIKLCRYYNEQYGTKFISVMPTNLYGPGDNFNLETAHVMPALIRKFHLAKLLNSGRHDEVEKDLSGFKLGFGYEKGTDPLAVLGGLGVTAAHVAMWGSGKPYREFLYSDDLADACIHLMNNYGPEAIGEFVNIGSGTDVTIAELAQLAKKVTGFQGDIVHDLSKPDGTPRKLLDISRIRSFGWEPQTGLEEGMRKTYEWYLSKPAG